MENNVGKWAFCLNVGLENVVQLLQPRKLLLIGARPGLGKSTFLRNLMEHIPNQTGTLLTYHISKTQSIPHIHSLRRLLRKASMPISALVIDEIQFMKYSRRNQAGTAIKLQKFLKYLRQIACELSVPVIILAKWPRLCEERSDHRPQLADLSVTDVTPEDFDTILFLYRNSYYYWDDETISPQTLSRDDMEMCIIKVMPATM